MVQCVVIVLRTILMEQLLYSSLLRVEQESGHVVVILGSRFGDNPMTGTEVVSGLILKTDVTLNCKRREKHATVVIL